MPIILQLMFLLSPILYRKEALGNMGWTAEWNPLYKVLGQFRDALISGEQQILVSITILIVNIAGIYIAIRLLEKSRNFLPLIL